MSKAKHRLQPGKRGEVLIAALGGLLIGKLIVEVVLGSFVHPIHWVAAIAISGIAALATSVWYRWLRPKR